MSNNRTKNKRIAEVFVYLATSFLLVFLDRGTKDIVANRLALYEKRSVIPDFFYINYVKNEGAAFSFLANEKWGIYALMSISIVCSLLFVYILVRIVYEKGNSLTSIAIMLLLSGAVGNLIDRVRFHYVIDFLRFDFGAYTFPIFNLADVYAVIGTFLVIVVCIFFNKKVEEYLDLLFGKKKEAKTK